MKKTTSTTIKVDKKVCHAQNDKPSLFTYPTKKNTGSLLNSEPVGYDLVSVNQQLIRNMSNIRADNHLLQDKNEQLLNHIDFLESILSGLQLIVSIRDLKRNNLLWHNDNFKPILGYRHKELQDINSNLLSSLYHPDDIETLRKRRYCFDHDVNVEKYNCVFRLKDKLGRWISFNSDWKVIKRDAHNRPLWVLEILSDAAVASVDH